MLHQHNPKGEALTRKTMHLVAAHQPLGPHLAIDSLIFTHRAGVMLSRRLTLRQKNAA